MKQCAVVIPCYKKSLSHNENIALEQCIKILGKYDIYLMLPQNLEVDYISDNIKALYFEKKWFESVSTYSEFMLKPDLYERLADYEYMLIYQLDAFVFYDKLSYFCSLGYDYIGAPWPDGVPIETLDGIKVSYVGNGGFSLRNTDAMLKFINEKKFEIAKMIDLEVNEDAIIAVLGKENLKIAPIELAYTFSYEMNLKKALKNNDNQLPFGCHALIYHDFKWWKEQVEKFGYKVCQPNKAYAYDEKSVQRECLMWKRFNKKDFKNILNKKFELSQNGINIWGIGKRGIKTYCILESSDVEFDCFIDKRFDEISLKFNHKVISPEQFLQSMDNINDLINCKNRFVIVAMKDTEEVEKMLLQNNLVEGKNYVIYDKLIDLLCEYYDI